MTLPKSNYLLIGDAAELLAQKFGEGVTKNEIIDYAIQGLIKIFIYQDCDTIRVDDFKAAVDCRMVGAPYSYGPTRSGPHFYHLADEFYLEKLHYLAHKLDDKAVEVDSFFDDAGEERTAVDFFTDEELPLIGLSDEKYVYCDASLPITYSDLYASRKEIHELAEKFSNNLPTKVDLRSLERDNLLKTVAVLACLYADASPGAKRGTIDRPNASVIGNKAIERLEKIDRNQHGLGTSIQRRISEGMKLLAEG